MFANGHSQQNSCSQEDREPSVGLSKKACRTAYNIIEYSIDNIPQHRSKRSQNKRMRIHKERLQAVGATDRYICEKEYTKVHSS